ncbi:MAG: prealbumin-like fold domain-containing protein [Anaerolineaceae bacterium]
MKYHKLMKAMLKVVDMIVIFVMLLNAPLSVYAFTDTDKGDYSPGETVTIFGDNSDGAGYLPGETVQVEVFGPPDGDYAAFCSAEADETGAWSCQVILPTDESAIGLYFYITLGLESGVSEQGDFTDLAIGTYDQCANDKGDGYADKNPGCHWINGNLNVNNSVYFEGDATVQRLWLTDLTPGVHTVTFKYGTTKGGDHAYDYLTTWDYSEYWATPQDRCEGIAGCLDTSDQNSGPIPDDPNTPTDGYVDDQYFVSRGGTITAITEPSIVSGTYAGDSETVITLSFELPSTGPMCTTDNKGVTTCGIAIWFGAHVALTSEWLLINGTSGAGGISGSPYHVALDAVDGAAVGQRDNQMQNDAIKPNGTIVIVKDAIPDSAQSFDFTLYGGLLSFNFALADDGDVLTNPPNSMSYSLPQGVYTATELNIPAGWNLTGIVCSDPSGGTTTAIPNASINLLSGETVTCTFTNQIGKGHIIVVKQTDPDGSDQSFEFAPSWGANFFLSDGQSNDSGELMPGTYSVAEVNLPAGWSLSGATCSDGSDPASIGLAPFETVTCTFNDYRVAMDLTVSKTATPHFTRTYQWTIDKSVVGDSTKYGAAGSLVPFGYYVSVNHDAGTDSGWYIDGVITVTNPNSWEAITLTSLTDSLGSACTLEAGPYVVPASGSLDVDYRCDLSSGASGTNTATAAWDEALYNTLSGSASGSTGYAFSTPDTIVDESIAITDTAGGALGSATVGDQMPKVFPYEHSWLAVAGTCTDYPNTASFVANDTPATGSDSALVTVCSPLDLVMTKTAVPTFTRTWDWTITKDFDATYNLFAGSSVTHDYTVTVDPEFTDSLWQVTGVITIQNPNLVGSFTANVSDAVNNGGTCVVATPSVTIPFGGSVDVGYTCTWTSVPTSYTGTNTATVTWSQTTYHTPTGSASFPIGFTFTNPTEIMPTITVDDDNLTSEVWNADRVGKYWEYDKDFTCPVDTSLYVNGVYSYDHINTATITGTALSDTAKVTVNCYAPVVRKDVVTYFNRDWDWTITKDYDGSYDLLAGVSVTHGYKVTVTPTYTDNFWGVKGTITVVNPNPDAAMTLTSVSDLAGGINAPVICPSLVVPAGENLACTYDTGAKTAPNANPFGDTNTATAFFAGANWAGSAEIVFNQSPTTEDQPVIDVTDTNGKAWSADRAAAEWTYSQEFSCSTTANYVNGGYSFSHINTATITQTHQNDNATVNVHCYAPVVSKTAETYWNRDWDWTITKESDQDYNLFAGGSVTHNYNVTVDPSYTDNFWGVEGTITVRNIHPSLPMTLTSLTDLVGEITAEVTCPSLVIPAASNLECTYDTGAQDSEDLNPFGDTNTATAVFASANWTGTAPITFSDTPTTEDKPVITVDDDNLTGENWSATRSYASWNYTKDFSCPTDLSLYKDGVLVLEDHINTAKINETGDSDTATVGVTCYAPMLSKTAFGTYDERHEWSVEKTVSPTLQSAFAGETVGYEWTVKVSEEVFEENFAVTGQITVVNPSTSPMIVALSDVLGDGTEPEIFTSDTCDFKNGTLTIPANTSAVCDYAADLKYTDVDDVPVKNTGNVVINGVTITAEAEIKWTPNVIRGEAQLEDLQGPLSETITGSGSWKIKDSYTCSTEASDYAGDGTYSFLDENTAIVSSDGAEEVSSSASITINCFAPVISKTAIGTYDERHEWDVVKTVSPESQSGFSGDTLPFTWTIEVTESVYEEKFAVTGQITVVNPSANPMTVTLSDVLGDGTEPVITASSTCNFENGTLTIPANVSAVCDYSADLEYTDVDDVPVKNTGTVVINGVTVTAEVEIKWTPNVIRGEAQLEDLQGPLSEIITESGSWEIKDSYTCSTDVTKYSSGYKYTETIFNTATVTSEEVEQDSETTSTAIDCYIPEISKTANGSYDEVHDWTIFKSVDPLAQNAFTGEKKDFTWTVTVNEIVTEVDFNVSGDITIENPNPDDPMTLTLSDVLNDGSVAAIGPCTGGTLVGNILTLPAGSTATCTYTVTPTGRYDLNAFAAALPNQVTMSVQYPVNGGPAYFPLTTVTNGGLLNGDYEGWCADIDHVIYQGTPYTANVYSSYETLPAGLIEKAYNLDLVNWILNQDFVGKPAGGSLGTFTYGDVQRAIWELIEDNFAETDSGLGTWNQARVNVIKSQAIAIGEGFAPTCGDFVAVILQPVGGQQLVTIAQVTFASLGVKCADTNVVTAVINGLAYPASKMITWTANVINPTTTVTDEQGELNETLTDSIVFTLPDSHTCSTDPTAYTSGFYQHEEVNKATLSTGGEATASTVVNCYAPVVSKTAAGAYDERHDWSISKSVTPTTQNAFAGDTVSYEWKVDVVEDIVEENFVVNGVITVANPSPMEMVVDLADVLDTGTTASITADADCNLVEGVLTIPAKGTATCDYTVAPDDRTATENTATAMLNEIDFSADATVSWTAKVIRSSATLDDNQNPNLPGAITDGGTWTYSENFTCSTTRTDYDLTSFMYAFGESNTATVKSEDFSASATASTAVNCYWPQIELTKTGDVLSKISDKVYYDITLVNNTPADAELRNLSCTISDPTIGFSKTVELSSGATDANPGLEFTIPQTDADPFINTASVNCSPLASTFAVTDSATWSTNLFQPKVEIIKEGPLYATSGDVITYTFTINNLSSSDSPNLVLDSLTDDVLGDLTDEAPAACDELISGGSCTFTTTYTVPNASLQAFKQKNIVTVHYHPAEFPNDISDTDDHTVLVAPKGQLTDTSFCPLTNDQFRLMYHLEVAPNTYRLQASNPGQFYYNGFYFGEPGTEFTMTMEIPYPFMTQEGAGNPIQIHDGTSLTSSGCFAPNPSLSGFTIETQAMTPASSAGNQIITAEDYTTKQLGQTTTVTVTGVVPATGFAYVTIHLDYGLKKTSGWKNPGTSMNNPVTNSTVLDMANQTGFGSGAVTIHGYEVYNFSRTVGDDTASSTPSSFNEIKKFAGFLGFVTDKLTGDPVKGKKVVIKNPTGSVLATLYTDADGYYMLEYKHRAKSATYTVQLPDYGKSVAVTVKANGFVPLDFEVP